MTTLDISDLHLPTLIVALWRNRKPASFFNSFAAYSSNVKPPLEPTWEEIERQLKSYPYIDYLAGRGIKTNFKDLTKVDSAGYDRDTENLTFSEIVNQVRSGKPKF
jgi:hypothetical protein